MGTIEQPTIELIPAKAGVCSDASITLDVLIRITPPKPEVHFPRAPLNLSLVLDRSGSMAGARKMPYARDAAIFAVRQLLPTDRVSVTVFDNEVQTVVPSTLATDKAAIERKIGQVEPRGSTDLHGGWLEGARQVRAHHAGRGLNRVLLLSDGLANVGVTDPNAIAAKVRALVAEGVGTTTLGVGADYNEDLMEAMARAGDGNYYYIESPVQLADIFQTELEGLMATVGQKVSLGLEPDAGARVAVADVLNDFEKAPTGRLMLPNLIVGMPISVVARLSIPPQPGGTFVSPMAVRLAWDDPGGKGGKAVRRTLQARLDPLPALALAVFSGRPADPAVLEQEALLMIARAQKEAALALERGDRDGTYANFALARGYAENLAMSPMIAAELNAIDALEVEVDEGNDAHATKSAKARAWSRRQSRPTPPDKKE